MNKYLVELHGTVDYDMMPRIKGAKLLCQGYIEDYEIEVDLDVIKLSCVVIHEEKERNQRVKT